MSLQQQPKAQTFISTSKNAISNTSSNTSSNASSNTSPSITVSFFTGMTDVTPVAHPMPFDDLEALCETPLRNTKDGDAFCPAVFNPPYRKKENATQCEILAFDFDALPPDITGSDLIKAVNEYRCFCYSTFSHQANGKGNRYRLVVAVDKPIPAKKYTDVATVLGYKFETLGIEIDASCTKPEQMLFLPACPDDRRDLFEFYTNQGCPLDWQNLLAMCSIKNPPKQPSAYSTDGLILEGNRNNELYKIAATKRNLGWDLGQIIEELVTQNLSRCRPLLDAAEVRGIAESASNNVPVTHPNGSGKLTQITMSETIAKNYVGRLCWIKESDTWRIFDEQTKLWEFKLINQIKGIVREELKSQKKALEASFRETGFRNEQAWRDIQNSENDTFLRGTTSVLSTEKDIEQSISIFDASPLLVGLRDGQCIDLKTNTVREIRGTDLLTQKLGVAYDPNALCPIWEKSILEWSCGDQTQVDFLQQWAGYCLSGLTNFHGLLFLFGDGRNGKSVFINILSSLLGDYSRAMNSESLMLQKRGNAATGDIARLLGARFVTAPEMPEGRVFDENLIKQMTGGDKLTARHLYKSDFEFTPTFKLLISGNHKPIAKGADWGFWRRVHLVPFSANIAKPDLSLTSRLLTELSGILNWCIKGWAGCNHGHFQVPANIKRHSDEYRDEMDLIKQWMDESLQASWGTLTKANDLYQSFRSWQESNGHYTLNSGAFYRKVSRHLGQSTKKSNGNYYRDYVII